MVVRYLGISTPDIKVRVLGYTQAQVRFIPVFVDIQVWVFIIPLETGYLLRGIPSQKKLDALSI